MTENIGNIRDSDLEKFFDTHLEYGTILTYVVMADWTYGKRIKVKTSNGDYLVYFFENEVVSIWHYDLLGNRDEYNDNIINKLYNRNTKIE